MGDLKGEDAERVRIGWRDLQARVGNPLANMLALYEQLPDEAIEKLMRRFSAGDEATDLNADELTRLAALREHEIPHYLAWGLRLRDGHVELLKGHREAPPDPTSGWTTGHALRLPGEFEWRVISRDAEPVELPVAEQIVTAIVERYPTEHHEAFGARASKGSTPRTPSDLLGEPLGEPLVYGVIDDSVIILSKKDASELATELESNPAFFVGDGAHRHPVHRMARWLPTDLVSRYGSVRETLLDGRFVHLDPACIKDIVAALNELGLECERNDQLVERACGS